MTTKLEQLKNAIWEAVPEIKKIVKCENCEEGMALKDGRNDVCEKCGGAGEFAEYRQIGIADVFRTIIKKLTEKYGNELSKQDLFETEKPLTIVQEQFERIFLGLIRIWDMTHDSLDWHAANSPETIDWLWEVICKKV